MSVSGPIGRLELHRPDRLNALSRQRLGELAAAARWFDTRRDVKVVGVTGAGRALCAGFDLGDFAEPDPELPMREVADLGRIMAEAITGMRALTVVGVHGRCVGGGLVLAAACDLRVATETAIFSIPEVALGIPLAWAGHPPARQGDRAGADEGREEEPPMHEPAAGSGIDGSAPVRSERAMSGRPAGRHSRAERGHSAQSCQRRRRGDRLDGERAAGRRHPRLGPERPREPRRRAAYLASLTAARAARA